MALCASCDRCRASKTRCDRQQPCGFCKQKYMMANRVTSVEGVAVELFGCVYSPAKRRGPVPGRALLSGSCAPEGMYSSSVGASGSTRAGAGAGANAYGVYDWNVSRSVSNTSTEAHLPLKKQRRGSGMSIGGMSLASLADSVASNGTSNYQPLAETALNRESSTSSFNGGYDNIYSPCIMLPPLEPSAAAMQQRVLFNSRSVGANMYSSTNNGIVAGKERQHSQDVMAIAQNSAQQQLAYVQQLQLSLKLQSQNNGRVSNASVPTEHIAAGRDRNGFDNMSSGNLMEVDAVNWLQSTLSTGNSSTRRQEGIGCDHPDIHKYLPLLHPTNSCGMHLRACYTLAYGGLLDLPPIPTDEEYCRRFDPALDPKQLPQFDIAALHAARFAELAMGALTNIKHEGMALLVALINASVLCLRNCVDQKVHPSLVMDVARAYFFHAILRSHLDDMNRYFKYRRVCLRQLSQLDGFTGVDTLMAAISFQDSLVYMIYNTSEDSLPDFDNGLNRHTPALDDAQVTASEKKYGISSLPSRVASNPINQTWIQGIPPIFINGNAPPRSRVIDALACAIRSAVDGVKTRPTRNVTQCKSGRNICRKRQYLSDAEVQAKSATEWAVEQHPDELSICSLLEQSISHLSQCNELPPESQYVFCGLRLLVKAIELVLDTDIKDIQLHSIFTILEMVMEYPMYLFQFGPTYHIVHSCAVVLAQKINECKHCSDSALFDKALSIYNGSRMVLENHRRKLPVRLQCRELPIPDPTPRNRRPVIDVSNVSSCFSRNMSGDSIDGFSVNEKKCTTTESKELDSNDQELLTLFSRHDLESF